MMMKRFGSLIIAAALLSCEGELPSYYTSFSYSFDFNESDFGWHGDFAEYPEGDSLFYELEATYSPLPAVLNTAANPDRQGFYVSGNNHNDDLFMFITGLVEGMKPNANYEIFFRVTVASKEPTGSADIGGLPGEDVYLKAGATIIEPAKVLDNGNYVMNLDKGNQEVGGADMIVLGNIAVAATTPDYKEIVRSSSSDNTFEVTTDDSGRLWIIVGTDSGYEGATSVYYTKIQVYFNEVD